MSDAITVLPGGRLDGGIRVPGDKSISHRVLMLGAVAEGESRVRGMPAGADVRSTAAALRELGVEIATSSPRSATAGPGDSASRTVQIRGRDLEGLRPPGGPIDCGNSGTTLRLLAGLTAGARLDVTLTGDASLRRRPMGRIADPLRSMGARVELAPEDRPPVLIRGGGDRLRGRTHRPETASAQVKSCILLAGLYADGPTTVHELAPTRDHTERLLRAAGAALDVERGDLSSSVTLEPPARLDPLDGTVPGDISSAVYWIAAASLLPGSDLEIADVGLNPSRSAVLGVLRGWGAGLEARVTATSFREPRGTIRVEAGESRLTGGDIGPEAVPSLIDELPLLAVLGPFTERGVKISGASELRVKESDRIATVVAGLRDLGAGVEERPDGLVVEGGRGLDGGVVDAAGDHRIALSFTAAAVAARGPVTVRGAGAMDVSYPGFAELVAEARGVAR